MKVFSKCINQVTIRVRLLWILLMIFGVILPLKAFGDESFRCKGRIISIGDYKTRVLDLCGEPKHSEQWEEWHYIKDEDIYRKRDDKRYYGEFPVKIQRLYRMERWVYDFGSTRFKRYLRFRNNELIHIETGDKGGR